MHDAHNTLVVLPAAGVVAKVSTSTLGERGENALRRELSIGLHLSARNGPIAAPLPDGAGGPHEVEGLLLTLWSYHPSEPRPEAAGVELGNAMRAFHHALADFPDPLPPLKEKLARAADLLANPEATPQLTASDRRLTASVYEQLQLAEARLEGSTLLHGEPHAENVLWTDKGPLFIDFEAACTGPREWDVAYLPEEARGSFPECDEQAIELLRKAISFCVAAWCWAQPGRATEVDEAALYHLDVLRQASRPRRHMIDPRHS
jgi:Ser/Thr protein kinase RdoA (MazF antagonist)